MLDRNPHSDSRGAAPCGPADEDHQAAESIAVEPQVDASPDCTVRSKSIKEKLKESSRRILGATPGGARLAKRLGKLVYDSWFRRVRFVGQRDQLLLLQADSRFIADHIEQQFEPRIIECFQPEHKGIVRIRVMVPRAARPEGGAKNSGGSDPGPVA